MSTLRRDLASGIPSMLRLRNFLVMGFEGNQYAPGTRQQLFLQEPKVHVLEQLIADGKGPEVVQEVVAFCRGRRGGSWMDAVMFTMAVCAHSKEERTELAAYEALPEVCATVTALLKFVNASEKVCQPNGTGWGRRQRRFIVQWYNSRDAKHLAEMCTRRLSKNGWKHRDVIRLSHAKPKNDGVALVLKYLVKGFETVEKEFSTTNSEPSSTTDVLNYLKAVHELKHATDNQEAAFLIRSQNLALEQVPTTLLKSQEVWSALLPNMSFTSLLSEVVRLSCLGSLHGSSPLLAQVLDVLKDRDRIVQSKIHPVQAFLTMKKYEESFRPTGTRPGKRRPMSSVLEALRFIFTTSLQMVLPTGKRYMVAIDVRNPMVHTKVHGSLQLTSAEAAALLVLWLLHAGSHVTAAAFGMRDMVEIDLKKEMTLSEIAKRMRETPMGPVNCAKPLLWATEHKQTYDAIFVCTDNQTKIDDPSPYDALCQYRQALNLPNSKLVIFAFAAKRFNTITPEDSGMMNVAGFDQHIPEILENFLC